MAPFIPGLGEKIALSFTIDLVKASAAGVRRRFAESDSKKALQAAIAQALDEAQASIEVPEDLRSHYEGLLEEFFRREKVVEELARLLDPRPDVELDFAALTEQFETEHDPETLQHLKIDSFLRAFASAFYGAAASQPALKGNLEMKLLGEMVKRTGLSAQANERTAAATEQMAGLLQKYLEDQNGKDALLLAVHTARDQGMLTAFQAFEGIAAGMFKAGFDFGVGRTGLIEIGGDLKALPPAQADTIRTLAGDLRQTVLAATPGPAELDALEQRYRQHVIRWFENLQFQGLMRTPRPIVLPLEDVYVELRAVAEVPDAADAFSVEERRLLLETDEKNPAGRRELMSQLDALRRERWSRTLPERTSIAESLHRHDRRAFVILGDPGSGKTTLLHFLALIYARGPQTAAARLKIEPSQADRLPIFVPLAAFDDMLRESRRAGDSLNLLDFLPRYYDRRRGLPGLEPLFRRALESGRAIVLLDGLDEVIDIGTRTYVAEQAGALINEWSPRGVRFAVSSRFVGYREAPVPGSLPTLSVLDFGMPEIQVFVHRWAEAYERWAANGESPEMFRRARTLEADLLTDVKSNESVRRLAANPLMITMLALLRRQVGRLPHRRVQLYESYVGALLESWMDARSQGAREQSVEILDRHQAENLLIPLALWLQKEKPSGTAGRAEIQQKLTEICLEEAGLTGKATRPQIREVEEKALRFLQEMRQMTGLLIERGHDAFGFLHLTFQEYFAGRALARLGDEERLATVRPNRHDPRWREPILLCAGRLGVVENRRLQVTEFVRGILDCPDDTEEKLHRNLLLALAMAGDDVNLDPGLVSDMVRRAVACLPTRMETLEKGLVGALGQLVANGMVGAEECFGNALASEDSWQRWGTVQALARFSRVEAVRGMLLERLADSNWSVAATAFNALTAEGETEEKVHEWARTVLESEDRVPRTVSVGALAGIAETNPAIRAEVLKMLEDSHAEARMAAAQALARHVVLDAEVRRAVLAKLDDPDPNVQVAACEALSTAIEEDAEVRRAVLAKLDDSAIRTRRAALRTLSGMIGADDVRRAVRRKLDDEDAGVRIEAIRALAKDTATRHEIHPVLLTKLAKGGAGEKAVSIEILAEHFSSDAEATAILRTHSTSASWLVRQSVAAVLGENIASPVSLAILGELLENRDALETLTLLETLAQDPVSCRLTDNEKWRAYWLSRMTFEDSAARSGALIALGSLVDKDQEVRRAVLERLGDESIGVRQSALSALSGAVVTDEEVRRAVLERLGDESIGVRRSALSALSGAVVTDEEVRRAVLERLGDESIWVRQSALSALSGAVVTDEEVRRTVLERLGDERIEIRQSALNALSGAVVTDEEVRRAVLERLGDESLRRIAVIALASLFGKVADVTRAVIERLADQDFLVRRAAVEVIADGPLEDLDSLLEQIRPWLMVSDDYGAERVQSKLARRLGSRIPSDWLTAKLSDLCRSTRLGASLTLLNAPGGPSDDVLSCVFKALEDRRGLEAYPAQLTAASFLINRDKYSRASIELCLDALDYGTQPWEGKYESPRVRQQAALVLGKLEPLFFEERIYGKLLQVMENDPASFVKDAAYGALVRLAQVREQVGAGQSSRAFVRARKPGGEHA